MGSARAPVVGSGLVPAWICRVSKLQFCGLLTGRSPLGQETPRRTTDLRPCRTAGADRPALPLEHLGRGRGRRAASPVLDAASREPAAILGRPPAPVSGGLRGSGHGIGSPVVSTGTSGSSGGQVQR